jgi:hypothetical protein
VEQHVVSVGDGKPVLVVKAVGCALDQREEALAPRRNVRAVLNVVRRPETLRSCVVPLVGGPLLLTRHLPLPVQLRQFSQRVRMALTWSEFKYSVALVQSALSKPYAGS